MWWLEGKSIQRCALIILLITLATGRSLGQTDGRITVSVVGKVGRCPAAADVARELGPLLRRHRIEVGTNSRLRVRVQDLGAHYRIRVKELDRTIRDERRRCGERARMAAVAAALAIEPPWVEPERRRPEAKIGRRAPRRQGVRVALEIGSVVDGAPFGDPGIQPAVGLAVRGWFGWRHIGIAGGIGVATPSTIDLGGGKARLIRIPLDVGARVSFRGRSWEVLAELGLAATILQVDGRDLLDATGGTRLDLGIRVSAVFRHWPGGRLGWFLGPVLTVSPRAFQLFVEPIGEVTTTPRLRVGAVVGVAIRLN